MIDIHSHILPGLDDGASTLDDAVEMLRIAARAGTTDIVATPHANLRYAFDPDVVARKIGELSAAAGPAVRIYPGCDFHLTVENIAAALAHPARYCINGGRYLLIEFPEFAIPRTAADLMSRFLSAGIVPVITHPERHPSLKKDLGQLRGWVAAGCLVQVTAQSLTGRFGSTAFDAARELLRERLVHFVASDAHDPRDRTPALDEGRDWVTRHYGEERARALFADNPRAALSGAPIQACGEGKTPSRWRRIFGRA